MPSPGDIQLSSAAMPNEPMQADAPSQSPTAVYGESERETGNPEELKNEALPREQVESFLWEIMNQPNWRREADKCADYYDNNQLSAETVERLQDRGQPPLITNLIKPTIDTVLGMEVKSRTDWRVRPNDQEGVGDDFSQALSSKLKEAEIESRADRACSDAYAAQLKAGLGWVEVNRESDPFKYAYRARSIHRREIFWDWRAEQSDLTDARYLIRRRWQDLDAGISMFPQYASLFRMMTSAWSGFDPIMDHDTGLVQAFDVERDTKMDHSDWRDLQRKRICLYEVWYRKWVRGYVMTLPNGKTIEADFNNPRHNELIVAGIVQVKQATFQKVRLAWYCGPHFLYDIPTPYSHGYFPYVPFFGYREDQTSVPYGLVRAMISPQDEINARKSKMLWSLNSRRVITDSDAVKDHSKAMEEVARPDAYIILDKNRSQNSQFRVEPGGELATQQFQVMQESKLEIAEASGIHKSMMGQNSNASSGLAINSLVEQGMNTLAEINDNFRFARRMVGEMIFSMLQEDMSGKPIQVPLGEGKRKKVVVLNEPVVDPQTGQQTVNNDVSKIRAKVVLDDIPSTPTFRMQQLSMLTEITKALPPEAQTLIIDFIVNATDLPDRAEVVDRLRKGLNLPDDSPEAQQAADQQSQQQQAIQQQQIQLEMAEREAKVEQIKANTQKIISEIQAAGMQGDGEAVQAIRAQAEQQMQAMQQELLSVQQQLFAKQMDEKASTEEINIKTNTEITLGRMDADAAILREREITQRELEQARIAAASTIRAAEIAAINKSEIDALRTELSKTQAELQSLAKEKEEEAKEPKAETESPAMAAALTALAQNQTAMASIMAAPRETKIVEDKDGRAIGAVSTMQKPTAKKD